MVITKREIIASIAIVFFMLILGVLIGGKINEVHADNVQKYNTAIKIDRPDIFQHCMDTSIGNAFIYGELITLDPVTYPDIKGEYFSVSYTEERYTRHTRTTTDKDGKQKEEEYWTWDYAGSDSKSSTNITFLGIPFNSNQFDVSESWIDTVYHGQDHRFTYYGSPSKATGTIFASLLNGKIKNKSVTFYNGSTIEETIKFLSTGYGIIIFWTIWIILICAAVYGFYYIDNRWLE